MKTLPIHLLIYSSVAKFKFLFSNSGTLGGSGRLEALLAFTDHPVQVDAWHVFVTARLPESIFVVFLVIISKTSLDIQPLMRLDWFHSHFLLHFDLTTIFCSSCGRCY